MRQNKLFTNKSKCLFAQSEIEYLNHLISKQEVRTDPKKIEVVVA